MEHLGTSLSAQSVIETEWRQVDGAVFFVDSNQSDFSFEDGLYCKVTNDTHTLKHSHVMLVRVAIIDPFNHGRLFQQPLSRIIHGCLNTGGIVRGEHVQRDSSGRLGDLGEINRLTELDEGVDGQVLGQGDRVVESDRSGEQSVGDLYRGVGFGTENGGG